MTIPISAGARGRTLAVALATALALGAAGCGEEESDTTGSGGGAQTGASEDAGGYGQGQGAPQETTTEDQASGDSGVLRTITVRETSFDLSSPAVEQEGEKLTVSLDRAGTYTFEAVNEADIVHALAVEGQGVQEGSGDIEPGGSGELTVTLSEPGEYALYCPVANHRQLGMDGSVSIAG